MSDEVKEKMITFVKDTEEMEKAMDFFDPRFIKKRETMLAEGMAEKIIGMYALGTSTREIGDWMEENLGSRISPETVSAITDRVLPEIKAWRSRPLE